MRRGPVTERPHGGPRSRSLTWGGTPPPSEENAHLPGFTPERAHLLLKGVYGDFPHHNNELHLEGGIADDALWQHSWPCLAAHSANWCATPSGALGRRFTAVLAAECRRVIPPRLCPYRSHKEVGRSPSQRDPRQDHAAHGPMGERSAHKSGGRSQGGRGFPRGQGRLQQQGGGRCRGQEILGDSALGKAPVGCPSVN